MCFCCFPGFCSEYCRLFRFACCTRFKRTETKESVMFTALVPGVTADDIQVQVESGNLLRVTGNLSSYKVTSNGTSTRTETANGNFVKLYKLPKNILADKIQADVDEDGFIAIIVPKSKMHS